MSSEGTITADIIKNAMFNAAEEIEGRYKTMPKTFGDYWTLIKNKATQAFTPIIEKINKIINSPKFEEFFNNLCIGIQLAAEAINLLIDGFSWLCQVLEPFAPIIWAVIGALMAYKVYTMLAAAGQSVFNAALAANPIGLIVAAIVALIIILGYLWLTNDEVAYNMIYAWDMLTLAGMLLWLGLQEAFYGIAYVVLWTWKNILKAKLGIVSAFYGLKLAGLSLELGFESVQQGIVNGFIWMYNQVVGLLNKLGGKFETMDYADFTSGTVKTINDTMSDYLNSTMDTMKQIEDTDNAMNEIGDKMKEIAKTGWQDIINKSGELGRTRQDRVDNRNNWIGDLQNKINGALDIGNSFSSKLNNGGKDSVPIKADGGKLDSVGEVSMSDEDLRYMKDFAEQEFVNKFTTATLAPSVSFSFGDVHENADVEKLRGRIEEILEEELSVVADGDYD